MAQQIKYNATTGGENWLTDLMGAGLDLWGSQYGLDIPDEAYSSTKFGQNLAKFNTVAKPIYGTAQRTAMSMVAGQAMGGSGVPTGELPVGEEQMFRQMGGGIEPMPIKQPKPLVVEDIDVRFPDIKDRFPVLDYDRILGYYSDPNIPFHNRELAKSFISSRMESLSQPQQASFVDYINQFMIPREVSKMQKKYGGDATMPYEAEGGEVVEQGNAEEPMVMDGSGQTQEVGPGAVKVEGPQHEQGGVDMQGGQYVFSDTLKTMTGETFAKAAEKLYAELEKIIKLYAKNNDRFSRSAYKRMAERVSGKLSGLRQQQETQRAAMPETMQKKTGGWIKKAVAGMRKDKPCTGSKFGGPSCPPGSKRYNLAKTFRKMAKSRKFGGPTAEKAAEIIRHGTVRGKSLTTKQKGYFGMMAGKKHGGNIDMKKYHNLSDEDYDKMVKSAGSMMMKFGGNLEALRRKPASGSMKPNMAHGGPTPSSDISPAQYALAAGQMIGPAYDMWMATKKLEDVNYPRIQAELISLKAGVDNAIKELDRQRNVALNTIRETATSAQEYLQNARAVDSDIARKKAAIITESQEKEANLNAAVKNQANVGNVNIGIQEEIARSQGKAARQEAGARGAYGMGEAFGGIGQDVARQKMNKQKMGMLGEYWESFKMPEKQPETDWAAREAEYRTTPYELPPPKVFTDIPTPLDPYYLGFDPYTENRYLPRKAPVSGAPYAF